MAVDRHRTQLPPLHRDSRPATAGHAPPPVPCPRPDRATRPHAPRGTAKAEAPAAPPPNPRSARLSDPRQHPSARYRAQALRHARRRTLFARHSAEPSAHPRAEHESDGSTPCTLSAPLPVQQAPRNSAPTPWNSPANNVAQPAPAGAAWPGNPTTKTPCTQRTPHRPVPNAGALDCWELHGVHTEFRGAKRSPTNPTEAPHAP